MALSSSGLGRGPLKCGANIERLFELCKLLQRFFRKHTFPITRFYSLYYFVINAK